MKHNTLTAALLLVLLTASCGRQHKAEAVVSDFIEANLADPNSLSGLDFRDIDSTRLISDSLIGAMRLTATANTCFRQPIDYGGERASRLLIFTRATYRLGDRRCQDTYYIDSALTRVVAFKSNDAPDE